MATISRQINPQVIHQALNTIHDATDILNAWSVEKKESRISRLDAEEIGEYIEIFSKANDSADMLKGSYVVLDNEMVASIASALAEAQQILNLRSER